MIDMIVILFLSFCMCIMWGLYYKCCINKMYYNIFRRKLDELKSNRMFCWLGIIASLLFLNPVLFIFVFGFYVAINGIIREIERVDGVK